MKKVHIVCRVVTSHLGGTYIHPVQAFDDEKIAEQASAESQASFAALSQGTIMVQTPQGPRSAMSVMQFLHELGIASLKHPILQQEVKSSLLFTPTASIIQ